MSLKEFPSIQNRMSVVSEYAKSPEAKIFDTSEVYSCLSDRNKDFFSPISEHLKIYLNCLKNVVRWKEHTYQEVAKTLNDNDYGHTLEMLKISNDFKEIGLNSVNFDDVELTILIHDGSEIITDDISINHPSEMNNWFQEIKDLEPRLFNPCILNQIKEKELLGHRKELRNLYNKYESRQNNPLDAESHLVKLIDVFQGNNFGLENVYSKTRLNQVYGEGNVPVDPDCFIVSMIHKEVSQMKITLDSLKDPQEKSRLLSYYQNQQFPKYSNPEYGFQELSSRLKPLVDGLSETIR